MLAAQAFGNDKQTKARLLRELLTESNAFGFLLGSGSHGGEGHHPSAASLFCSDFGDTRRHRLLIQSFPNSAQRKQDADFSMHAAATLPLMNMHSHLWLIDAAPSCFA